MKLAGLLGIVMMVLVNSATAAKEQYWQPKCENGAKLEQRKGKQAFRCRREGGLVEEFRIGRCERNQRLRRTNRIGISYACLGTTILTQGDAGTSESFTMFVCPPGYRTVNDATSPTRTCFRSVPGTAYERPTF